jgi:transposase-like protein
MSKKRNPPWTKEYAREVLARVKQSGKGDREAAKELGVAPQQIWRWRHRLRSEAKAQALANTTTTPAFVEVAVAREQPQQPQPFAIHTRSGRTVTVWPGFDAGELGRVVAVVEGLPC